MARRKRFNAVLAIVLAIICLFIGFASGYIGRIESARPTENDAYTGNTEDSENNNGEGDGEGDGEGGEGVIVSGSISIHFLELGNKYTGDCTYIKAGDTDILIDAGSKKSSIPTISEYINQFVTDGKLEYVIVTHAHEDHYAGFATNTDEDSIFDLYECETIIDFSMTNQKQNEDDDGDGFGENLYSDYLRERADEIKAGATHYTAAQCIDMGKNKFKLSETATLTVLNQKFYREKAETENDYSVCTLITDGDNRFLFTGDLEEEGEESLVELNHLPTVDVYKAGHHGSRTSSHDVLLNVIQPEIVCVCCCAGSSQYNAKPQNTFPSQDFVNRVSKHTDKVYVTTLCIDYKNNQFESMNGNIVVSFTAGEATVNCSNSNTLLKDTEWFKNNRTCPENWK